MAEQSVIFAGRALGKTYTIMTEIHELILAGERPGIMVVFPHMSYLHWWANEWRLRFPSIPLPAYTVMQSMDRVRGRRLKHVFVEDVESIPDGIYDEKLVHLHIACGREGGHITFTCSPLPEAAWRKYLPDWAPEAIELRRQARAKARKDNVTRETLRRIRSGKDE